MITSSLLHFPCGAIYRDVSLSPTEVKVSDASRSQTVARGKTLGEDDLLD